MNGLGLNPCLNGERPATNRLSRGTACGLSSELYVTFTVLTLSSRCHVYRVLRVSPGGLSFVAVIARG